MSDDDAALIRALVATTFGDLQNGIWSSTDGLHHVIVDGHQVGPWSKRRWAERDLREKLREAGRQS